MATIEQLENELNQKIKALNESLNAQYVLRETLKNNTKTMGRIERQLKNIEISLKVSNEAIYKLKQENQNLKLSSDQWMLRAIQLEFKVLSVGDVTKNRNGD